MTIKIEDLIIIGTIGIIVSRAFFIAKQLNHNESNTIYEPRRVGSLRAWRDAY